MKPKSIRKNTTHEITEWIEDGVYYETKKCLKTGKETHRSRNISSHESNVFSQMLKKRREDADI